MPSNIVSAWKFFSQFWLWFLGTFVVCFFVAPLFDSIINPSLSVASAFWSNLTFFCFDSIVMMFCFSAVFFMLQGYEGVTRGSPIAPWNPSFREIPSSEINRRMDHLLNGTIIDYSSIQSSVRSVQNSQIFGRGYNYGSLNYFSGQPTAPINLAGLREAYEASQSGREQTMSPAQFEFYVSKNRDMPKKDNIELKRLD